MPAPFPKSLKIGPYRYKVTLAEEPEVDGEEVFGFCDLLGLEIVVGTLFNGEPVPRCKQVATLLHEGIEAIVAHNCLEVSHEAISVLAVGVYAMLVENKLDVRGMVEG